MLALLLACWPAPSCLIRHSRPPLPANASLSSSLAHFEMPIINESPKTLLLLLLLLLFLLFLATANLTTGKDQMQSMQLKTATETATSNFERAEFWQHQQQQQQQQQNNVKTHRQSRRLFLCHPRLPLSLSFSHSGCALLLI